MKISIGVPVRNESENIPTLISVLDSIEKSLRLRGIDSEILINENCSVDNSLELLRKWEANRDYVFVNELTQSLTFQQSIQNMMSTASGDAFMVYQSDMQDPPEMIEQLVGEWQSGSQAVLGVIRRRSESIFDRTIRRVFYWLLTKSSDGGLVAGVQDFFLIEKSIYERVAKLPSEGLFIRGFITTNYPKYSLVPYERNLRKLGNSKFRFAQKYSLALDGILLYGTKFVRFVSVLSFMMFVISFIASAVIVVLKTSGIATSLHGWASIAVGILLLISMQGMATGLVLEYLIRIYRLAALGNASSKE